MNTHRRNKGFLFLLIPLVFFAVTGIVMWLWNTLLPEIIGVKAITYWQAMGILVLSKILFGGFHGKGGKCHKFSKHQIEQKMEGMSLEEKEKLKEIMQQRFGGNPFCKR